MQRDVNPVLPTVDAAALQSSSQGVETCTLNSVSSISPHPRASRRDRIRGETDERFTVHSKGSRQSL